MYFEGLADHDIIICDKKGLRLKGTGNMSEDLLSKITQSQTHESRMTPLCFGGVAETSLSVRGVVTKPEGLWDYIKILSKI